MAATATTPLTYSSGAVSDDSFTTCCSQRETADICVPRDFRTVQAAVRFANSELQKQSAKTLRILVDSSYRCESEEPIVVDYSADQSQLVIDVQDPARGPAELSMDTREPNQPLVRLVRGNLVIRNMRLEHCSPVDLSVLTRTKSSNAAIVMDPIDQKSSILLEHLTVTSFSGKGIINRSANPQLVQQNDVFVARMWQ